MPRTQQILVYRFSELSEAAKCRAKQAHAAVHGYTWAEEALESLKKLAEHFDGRLRDYSVDFFAASHSWAKFEMPKMTGAEIRRRMKLLGAFNPQTLKGLGDCKLTGFCMDEDAIDGFRKALDDGERDLGVLMEAAFWSWLKAAQDDCEAQYEDEEFAEYADGNGYEYTDDGEAFR